MEEIKIRKSEDKRYPLSCAVVHFNDKRQTGNILVCGYHWKPIDVVTDIEAITLQDFFLNTKTGYCEEAEHCLYFKCAFNKTTLKSFVAHKNWSDTIQNQLKKKWKNYKGGLVNFQRYADVCRDAYNERGVTAVEIGRSKNDDY